MPLAWEGGSLQISKTFRGHRLASSASHHPRRDQVEVTQHSAHLGSQSGGLPKSSPSPLAVDMRFPASL